MLFQFGQRANKPITKDERIAMRKAMLALLVACVRTGTMASTVLPSDHNSVTTTVNYSQSLVDVKPEFYLVHSNITDEHFPPESGGTAQVMLEPVYLNRDSDKKWISTNEAMKRLEAQGSRPATLRELLAYAKANPNYQRCSLVVALGSSWVDPSGNRNVPYLNDWNGKRALDLRWIEDDGEGYWWFLVVRK